MIIITQIIIVMNKKLLVMTSFGPVPFDAVKNYLPKEVADAVEQTADNVATLMDPENVEFYIHNLAEEKGWDLKKMVSYLDNLGRFSPTALFEVLCKEVALFVDSKYEDSIVNAEEIYIISKLDGKIHKVEGKIKNFRSFAAFRTVEDAKFAHKVLSRQIKNMFRGE